MKEPTLHKGDNLENRFCLFYAHNFDSFSYRFGDAEGFESIVP